MTPGPGPGSAAEVNLGLLSLEYDDPDFGASYDALAFSIKANSALKSYEVIDGGRGGEIDYVLRIADDEKTLSKEISSSVEASATVLGAEVSGSASLLQRTDMKAATLSLIARMDVSTSGRKLDRGKIVLKPELDDMMRDQPAEFYRIYGTHFLFSAAQGGEITVVLSKDYQSIGEKTQAAVSAKAKYGPVSGSASFKVDIESFTKSDDTRLQLYQTGWLGPVPSMDIKELLAYVGGFAALVKGSPQPATYTVMLAPYGDFASPAASKAFEACIRPVSITVGQFVAALTAYVDVLADIAWAQEIGLGDPAVLAGWATEVTRARDVLQEAWIENRGTLGLPDIQSIYASKKLSPPDYYQSLIGKVLEGKPLRSGDMVYLRSSEDQLVIAEESVYQGRAASQEYTPTLGGKDGATPAKGIVLQVTGPVAGAALRPGDSVHIQTTESAVGEYRLLSAFTDTDMYYYKSGYGNNQLWTLVHFDGSSGPLKYGDKIVLTNVGWNQQLISNGKRLTTTSSGSHFWYFDPV